VSGAVHPAGTGRIRALALDLDDTLWPFAPVAARIEAAMQDFLAAHAPATAARFSRSAADEAFEAARRDHDHLRHDMAGARREALRSLLGAAGDDPALADRAIEVIDDVRQVVDPYPDVPPALDRLAAAMPIIAITNGSADLTRTGVARWFEGGVISAFDAGVAKPDRAIFALAVQRLRVAPGELLHAGDDLERDVHGALGAGLRAAWVHRDLRGDAPEDALRARDLLELADALGV
jgi:FMN hydrolase / 5-amino-6-(5-phospho-D-ribitylamino)uracil phosphatase